MHIDDWLPLPLVLTLAAGMVMLGVFLHRSLGAALAVAVAIGLLGWWWWHHSVYHGQPRTRTRKTRAVPAGRKRRAGGKH